ncbi:hypothetical protein ACFCZV_13330 [Streptomyces hydrogenans]|uniref:hypothetical protein n=1 Tax=Streptomyces hydrogenans TaxID=1873719 RepID=UPI0035E1CE3D
MTFEYRDADGARLRVEATHANTDNTTTMPMVVLHTENPHDDDLSMVFIPLARIEEVVAGIRDTARTAARQTTGQDDTELHTCPDGEPCPGHDEPAGPAVGQPAEAHDTEAPLTVDERKFLHFALDQAAEEMAYGDGFTDEDQAALDSLRCRAGKDER